MIRRGEANNRSHGPCPQLLRREQSTTMGNIPTQEFQVENQLSTLCRARHAIPVKNFVQSVNCVGGVASWTNQVRARPRRRAGTSEQSFQSCHLMRACPASASPSSRSGRSSRPSTWRSAPASPNGWRNTSSTANASPTRAPRSRCLPRLSRDADAITAIAGVSLATIVGTAAICGRAIGLQYSPRPWSGA